MDGQSERWTSFCWNMSLGKCDLCSPYLHLNSLFGRSYDLHSVFHLARLATFWQRSWHLPGALKGIEASKEALPQEIWGQRSLHDSLVRGCPFPGWQAPSCLSNSRSAFCTTLSLEGKTQVVLSTWSWFYSSPHQNKQCQHSPPISEIRFTSPKGWGPQEDNTSPLLSAPWRRVMHW